MSQPVSRPLSVPDKPSSPSCCLEWPWPPPAVCSSSSPPPPPPPDRGRREREREERDSWASVRNKEVNCEGWKTEQRQRRRGAEEQTEMKDATRNSGRRRDANEPLKRVKGQSFKSIMQKCKYSLCSRPIHAVWWVPCGDMWRLYK